jgi:uncharacterized membrane protein YgcG
MKPIVAILGLLAAVAAGAVGGIVASTTTATPVATDANTATARPSSTTTTTSAAPTVDNSDLQSEITALQNELARLRSELVSLREGRTRESATATPASASTELIPAESLAIIQKDAILRVIAEERADLQRKEDEARKQRELEQATQRAERVAKELNLSPAEQTKLAEVYVMEREKRDEFMRNMRSGEVPDREQMRQSFQEYREWRTNELTTRLGADLATKVNEYDGDRMGFGGRGMGGGDGGGGTTRVRVDGGGGGRPSRNGGNNANPPGGG